MTANQKGVNLALQGGGAHGAFAWGVLDRLLEDGRLTVEGISATSAGALNAVVYASGVSVGGAEGAREKLHEVWQEISWAGQLYSPVRAFPWERWLNGFNMAHSATFHLFEAMTRVFSPYQLNPLNFNPLRDVLERVVDFDRLSRSNKATRLYISATNVRTGKIRVFKNEEMSPHVILASACLPYIFQAVEIDGEHYWDGGYMGNPAIFPLIYNSQSKDVILVHINPLERAKLPTTASEIFNRINEISFNSSLMREMRAIAFVTKLIDEGALDSNTYSRMRIHSIRSDDLMIGLGVASKLNPDWDFLCYLRDVGRRTAAEWLEANFEKVGVASSIDIDAVFL
jgi:NTE family protein